MSDENKLNQGNLSEEDSHEGHVHDENCNHDHEGHVHDENCDHDHEHEHGVTVMMENEDGTEEEYPVVDEFEYNGFLFVLVENADGTVTPLRSVGEEGDLEFLTEEEFDEVAAAYNEFMDENGDDEDEDDEDEDDDLDADFHDDDNDEDDLEYEDEDDELDEQVDEEEV